MLSNYTETIIKNQAIRSMFSPPSMLHSDGKINQGYFGVPGYRGWSDVEFILLKKGMNKHGAHDMTCWRKIQKDYLPTKSIAEIMLKICSTLGRANLEIYAAWGTNFSESRIKAEYKKLKKLGEHNGCWINEMYCEDLGKAENRFLCKGGLVLKYCPAGGA